MRVNLDNDLVNTDWPKLSTCDEPFASLERCDEVSVVRASEAPVTAAALLTAAGWDESEHPRHPKGTPVEGGRFAPKDGVTGPGGLEEGDIFKFGGEDPGGPESIQWFRVESRKDGSLWAREIVDESGGIQPEANVFPLEGVVEPIEKLDQVPGVAGPLEPIFPESASESPNSSSHELYEVEIDGQKWFVKKVEATREVAALRDHVEPGRDLERELAAQVVYQEIREAVPEILDLRVAEVKEGNIAGLGHVIMSKEVPYAEDAGPGSGYTPGQFAAHSELSMGELRALSLYDWIIGNTDRHTGNIVRSSGGKAVAIDQGLAFPERNTDTFGRFHVLEFGLPPEQRPGQGPHDLSWPDDKQGRVIQHFQENWESIDAKLKPFLNENERRAMWRRIEYVNNSAGRFPTHNEWVQDEIDSSIVGYGWHPSVTLGQDEEANAVLDAYNAREDDPNYESQ